MLTAFMTLVKVCCVGASGPYNMGVRVWGLGTYRARGLDSGLGAQESAS